MKKRPRGRRPQCVPVDTAPRALDWVAQGKPLHAWSRQPGSVSSRAIHDWIAKDADFARSYAVARDIGFDAICESILTLADTQPRSQLELTWLKLRIRVRMMLLHRWYASRSRRLHAVRKQYGSTEKQLDQTRQLP